MEDSEIDYALPDTWNMPMSNCFTYAQLKSIPIYECHEQLVNLSSINNIQLLIGQTPEKMKPYISFGMWVRDSVATRLQIAQKYLSAIDPNYQIFVRYGYRHPEVQKKYFEDFYQKSKETHPNLSEPELLEYVHHYMAIPDVGGHPVGAAIDILLIDKSSNCEVDMGSAIADFSDMTKVIVFSKTISQQQLENRLLLRRCMMRAGFAPYDFEWWHFSYGDREWACYYKKDFAIYQEIDFRV